MFLAAVAAGRNPDCEIALRVAELGISAFPLSQCSLAKTPDARASSWDMAESIAGEIAEGVRKLRDAASPLLQPRRRASPRAR